MKKGKIICYQRKKSFRGLATVLSVFNPAEVAENCLPGLKSISADGFL